MISPQLPAAVTRPTTPKQRIESASKSANRGCADAPCVATDPAHFSENVECTDYADNKTTGSAISSHRDR
jgi:hypothetical protein